uniref:Uncharacterized protein LOC102805132 n=1 Tax=Saccoglossus kowalevskii TaxID=10224 RepID=A0ABM0MK95_SACKO|nr:PREDICTED: uncharacterized protein LOC102805132 [Saccoglossus kowalevskii]
MAKDEVINAYEALREVCPPGQEMLSQTDTCTAITTQLLQIVTNKKENTSGEITHGQQLHNLLQHDDNRSIFSTTTSRSSHVSMSSVEKRADAAAEIAAQEAELEMLKATEAKQVELEDLEHQQEILRHKQELKKREMERIEKEKLLEKAKAKFKVYDQVCQDVCKVEDKDENILASKQFPHASNDNTKPNPTQPSMDSSSLACALQNSLMSRLPLPEPPVFTGDPLQYIQWKTSFKSLIESRGISAAEKNVLFEEEARIACNPISSLGAIRESSFTETVREPKDKVKRFNRIRGTFSTESKQVNKESDAKKTVNSTTCLKKGHISRECRRRLTCEKCQGKHPTIIHDNYKDRNTTKPTSEASAVSCKVQLGDSNSTSMIVPVWVSSKGSLPKEVLTYALLDTQSDSTFILEDIAKALSIQCKPVRLKLSTMASASSIVDCNVVSDLRVRGMSSSVCIDIPQSYTRDIIPTDRSHISTTDTAKRWSHLQRIAHELPPLQDCEVGMLIGYNCPQALVPRETIIGKSNEPYAVMTDLGWSVVGYEDPVCNSATRICHRISVKEVPFIAPKQILNVLEADFLEKSQGEKAVSQDDIKFLNILETGIQQTESGHYSMPLPFKSGKPILPNSKRMASIRLQHLKKKFNTNLKYYSDYKRFMNDVIEKGEVEKVDDQVTDGKVWYIPHHWVYHPNKPEKIRVVFDCSARHGGTSLNDHLLTGPDLINSLIGVLCRFRKNLIAIMCDVEKFFVHVEDRNYIRF